MSSIITPFKAHLHSSIIPSEIAQNFITAHELATGLTMGATQQTAINGYIDRLSGNGTLHGTDLLTMFIQYGTTLMPCCPSNDSTASAVGYELDLLSATQQGEFLNFLPTDITVMGVQGGSSSAKQFRTFKGPEDYHLTTGFDFFYLKETCAVASGAVYAYKTTPLTSYLIPRHQNNGWVYSLFNGNFDTGLGGGKIWRGLCGSLQRVGVAGGALNHPNTAITSNLTVAEYVDGSGYIYPNYGGYSTAPDNKTGSFFTFHDGLWAGELSLYSVRAPGLTHDQIADLAIATDWYQDNVLSNASRKKVA